jgi:hypothetical protein
MKEILGERRGRSGQAARPGPWLDGVQWRHHRRRQGPGSGPLTADDTDLWPFRGLRRRGRQKRRACVMAPSTRECDGSAQQGGQPRL